MANTHGLWTCEYFLREAARVGPHTRRVIAELMDARPIKAQAFFSCRNVLSMGKHDNKPILEEACRRLVDLEGRRQAVSYTAVKNMMAAVRKEDTVRTTTQPHPNARDAAATSNTAKVPSKRDTRGAYLGGAEQFSIENLTKKGNN